MMRAAELPLVCRSEKPGYNGVMRILFLISLIAFSFQSTEAAGVRLGWEAYRDGNFERARELFDAAGTADGHAASCQTGLVIGGFFDKGDAAARSLHRALEACEAALAIDRRHRDARISYAIALGFEAKRVKKAGYAKASRLLLEENVRVWPDYAIAHAGLGGWHTAVAEAGMLARMVLRAKRSLAKSALEKAIALDASDIGVRYEMIKYLALGKKAERKAALAQIAETLAITAEDAFDVYLKEKLLPLRRALEAGDKKDIRAAVAEITAFNRIEEARAAAPYPLSALGDDARGVR